MDKQALWSFAGPPGPGQNRGREPPAALQSAPRLVTVRPHKRERTFMDIRRLKSFIVIVDTGSITRAADVLHIAQPALSQQLAGLEDHFQQKLLIRSQQGVTMTEAGRAVY